MSFFSRDTPEPTIMNKRRVMLLVSASIVFLSITIIYNIMISQQNLIENLIKLKFISIENDFNKLESSSYSYYKNKLKHLVLSDKELSQLFSKNKRNSLYEKFKPIYETLKVESPYFKVMHFHLADGTTLLRMHNPTYFGDSLRGVRSIVDAVHRHHIQKSGFEIGRHGPFYRIVQPVFSGNIYIGALEFGIKAHQLLKMAESDLGGQSAAYFLRDEWAKATNLEKKTDVIRSFDEFVLNSHDNELFLSLPTDFNLVGQNKRVGLEGNHYIFYSWPVFKDFQGDIIGGIVVLQNISALVKQNNHQILNLCSIIALVTSLPLLTLYICLNKMTKKSLEYHDKLRENGKVLLNAQKMGNIASWKYDYKHKKMLWTDEAFQILGLCPHNDLPNYRTFLKVVHPEDRHIVDKAYLSAIKNNSAYNVTYRIIRPNGEERIIQQQSENTLDANGKTATSLGMIHDITAFKKVEGSLRQSKEQWEKTFNSIHNVITLQDSHMNIVNINQAGRDILGISEQEAYGQRCHELFHGTDEPCPGCPLIGTTKTFKTYTKEITHEKLGRTFTVSASAVLNSYGELQNIVHVATDITEKKKIERRLFLNEKMTTIAGLAAGVAHEINTPLSVILQSQQVIKMKLDPNNPRSVTKAAEYDIDLAKLQNYLEQSKVQRMFKNSNQSAINAAEIVKSLLEFSRPHQKEIINDTNVADLLETTLNLAASDYDLKKHSNFINIKITRNYNDKTSNVPCVATEIKQVILNLIKNSAQSLTAHKVPDPTIILSSSLIKNRVRIEVEDNGPGIDGSIKSQIFDPFFTTKDAGEGTGLGLFVSHAIVVDKHKGNLWLESEPGKGVKFIVELPQGKADETLITEEGFEDYSSLQAI